MIRTMIALGIALGITCLPGCSNSDPVADATGTFEAVEVLISSEASGQIRQFDVNEGQELAASTSVGFVDTTQLYLRKKQLQAQVQAVLSKRPDVARSVAALKAQLETANHERARIENLVRDQAATTKQLDDIQAQVAVLGKQIDAQYSSLNITTSSITSETVPLHIQIEQLEDQLQKCHIVNPISGTVLATYAEPFEITAPGKPLYRIADVRNMTLRAYISADQLAATSMGRTATVLVDDGKGGMREYKGTIAWISDKAEFTPKTIQTRDERKNLVYAVKIRVQNDGKLRIGMYGDVRL